MARKGQGSLYRPTYTDRHGDKKESKVWWISYPDGKGGNVRESAKTTVKKEAQALLNQRLAKPGTAITTGFRFEELVQLVLTDYTTKGRKSRPKTKNLLARFSGRPAGGIGSDEFARYAAERIEGGAAPATVNRELAVVRRGYRLAARYKKVSEIPVIEMLPENNARKGFMESDEFEKLCECLPDYIRPLASVAYFTGWRKGELLSRRWCHVDFEAGWIRLEPGETKNGKGRQFPLIPPLRAVLEEQRRRKLEAELKTGRIVDALFFRFESGAPIRCFREVWKSATKRAGVPGRLFHDLRRTAARNMLRSGLSEHEAMQFTGHETPHIFRRYAIQDETTLKEAGTKYAAHFEQPSKTRQRRA